MRTTPRFLLPLLLAACAPVVADLGSSGDDTGITGADGAGGAGGAAGAAGSDGTEGNDGNLPTNPWEGAYSGEIELSLYYPDWDWGAICVADLDLEVDEDGLLSGNASCVADFVGVYEVDYTVDFEGEVNEDGDASGIAYGSFDSDRAWSEDFSFEGSGRNDTISVRFEEDREYEGNRGTYVLTYGGDGAASR